MRLVIIFDSRLLLGATGSVTSSSLGLLPSISLTSLGSSLLICSVLASSTGSCFSPTTLDSTGTASFSFDRLAAARYGDAPGVGSEFERLRPAKSGVLGCDKVGVGRP